MVSGALVEALRGWVADGRVFLLFHDHAKHPVFQSVSTGAAFQTLFHQIPNTGIPEHSRSNFPVDGLDSAAMFPAQASI